MSIPNQILRGRRVLLAEDELLIAHFIQEILVEAGCKIVGPFVRVDEALQAARTESVDIAVLDVNLAGHKIYPVADILEQRKIPFLLLTGYGQNAIPANRPGWQIITKPFRHETLTARLTAQLIPA